MRRRSIYWPNVDNMASSNMADPQFYYYTPSYGYGMPPPQPAAYFPNQATVQPPILGQPTHPYTPQQVAHMSLQMEMYHRHQAEAHAMNYHMHQKNPPRIFFKHYPNYPYMHGRRYRYNRGRKNYSRYPRRKRRDRRKPRKMERSQRAGEKSGTELEAKGSSHPRVKMSLKNSGASSNPNYKTTMCVNILKGHCRFGSRCNFAHSLTELRPRCELISDDKHVDEGTSKSNLPTTSSEEMKVEDKHSGVEDNNILGQLMAEVQCCPVAKAH